MDLEKKLKIIIIIIIIINKRKRKKKLIFCSSSKSSLYVIVDLGLFAFVLKMLETLNGIKIGLILLKKKKPLNWNFPKMLSLQHI